MEETEKEFQEQQRQRVEKKKKKKGRRANKESNKRLSVILFPDNFTGVLTSFGD